MQRTIPFQRASAAAKKPSWLLHLRPFTVPAIGWCVYGLLLYPYVFIRSLGDDWLPWTDGERVEHALFGGSATRLLQSHIYTRDLVWFDFLGFALHLSWFVAPFVAFLAVCVFERRRFPELLAWCLACAYVSTLGYLLLPMRPPWMEEGIVRILQVRSFIPYTGLDNNPVAAFPSLHAAMPMALALFFWLRTERLARVGHVFVAYALFVGFAVVYLGEHWVIDVAGGYGLAALTAAIFTSRANHVIPARIRAALARGSELVAAASRRPATPAAGAPVSLSPAGDEHGMAQADIRDRRPPAAA